MLAIRDDVIVPDRISVDNMTVEAEIMRSTGAVRTSPSQSTAIPDTSDPTRNFIRNFCDLSSVNRFTLARRNPRGRPR